MPGDINNLNKSTYKPTSQELLDYVASERYNMTSFAKDAYLLIIRELFRQNAGPFHYDDDPDLTKLHVSDRFEIPKEVQTGKPMIYLTRGRMGYSNLTIDNMAAMNMNTGKKIHTDLIRGTMIINCVSEEGLEAEHLASIIFTMLEAVKQEFMYLKFHHFAIGEILEERPLQVAVDTKLVEVPVTSNFSFSYRWAVGIMNSTPLNNIMLSRARPVGDGPAVCSSDQDSCGNNIGIDGSGLDCGPFENLRIKGEKLDGE